MNAIVSRKAVERQSGALGSTQPQGWALDDRMTVVLFAGMGGGCDGLEAAGFHVHVAINHDKVAVAVHEQRHPHTRHLRCDVFEADPREVTQGRGVRFLHASPDCRHFSVAKGSKPVSKRVRGLAWVICRWLGTVRPEVVTLENVWEITTWSPLIAKRDKATGRVLKLDGTVAEKGEHVPLGEQQLVPDPKKKGRIWRAFVRQVRERHSYSFEWRKLCCADYGVPTIRTRLFGVMKADGSEIVWPARTHAPRKDAARLGLKAWVGAHTIIDWSLPVKSIFGRRKPLADATLRRTARGVMRYVVENPKPFIVPITHAGDNRVHAVEEPLRTLTTAHRGELSVVAPHVAKFRPDNAGADIGEPLPTFTANSFEKRPGGAIPLGLVGATIVRTDMHEGAARNGVNDLDEPLRTATTAGSHAIVAAHLSKFNQNGDGSMPDEPLDTVVAGAPRHAVVAAHLIDVAHGEGQGRGVSEWPLDEPVRTLPASRGKAIAAATLIQTGYGEREGQAPRALDIEEPAGTQVAGGGKAALVAAFLAQHNTGEPGRPAAEPLSTIVGKGSTQGVVVAALGDMHGSRRDGRPIEEPLSAVSAGGRHAHLILGFLQKYFGTGGQLQGVDDPLHAVTAKARHGLVEVMVDRVAHFIDDIGIRMLEPEEGAAAHGFRKGALPESIVVDGVRRRLTKTEKYHLVGNSVPPLPVQLLAELNGRHEFERMVAAE